MTLEDAPGGVRELWCWVGDNGEPGGESITGVQLPDGQAFPLVFSQQRVARSAEVYAVLRNTVALTGKPQRLLHLTDPAVVDELLPGAAS